MISVTDLVGGVLPRGSLVVFLDAYFDESGTHDNSTVIAVAGYVAPREAWQQFFERPWQRLLDMNELPFFHMADFENRQPPYYNQWGNRRRIAVISDLVQIIKRSAMLGVSVAISRAHFNQAAEMLRGRLKLNEPYHLCAHIATMEVCHWLDRRGIREQVGYVFEDKPEATGTLKFGLAALNDAMRQLDKPTSRGPLIFAPKESVVQLQAADFLAYESYKQGLRVARLDERPIRQSLLALLHNSSVEYRSVMIEEHLLAKMAEMLTARSAVTPSPSSVAAARRSLRGLQREQGTRAKRKRRPKEL